MPATSYLNRLGLDKAADERAIKRAYARELKQIDLEADADGFQVLRHAYEMALHWVKQNPAAISFAPAATVPVLPVAVPELEMRTRAAAPVAAAPARDADTGENPAQLGQDVFDEFLAICGEMAAQGNARDSLLWRKHLQRCASDDRLLNIAARAHFEFFVARLLADGWRTGHEGLFVAARQVFDWEKDRRRLLEFGGLGAWLNQAIDECEMFTHQPSGDCSGQADAVTRVRADAAPSKRELITHVPHLRNMAARFPAWTAIIASTESIEQWMEMEQAIPKWRRRMRITKPASSTETSGGSNWWKGIVIIMVIRAVFALFGPSSTSNEPPPWNPPRLSQPSAPSTEQEKLAEAAYQRAAGNLYMPPGTRKLDSLAPPARPPVSAAEQLAEATYQRAAGNLYMPPGVPTLDSLPRPAQPVTVPLAPAGQDGRYLNDAEMKAISKRIQFHWPQDATGTHKVEFSVELDPAGAIKNLTKKISTGLPELDRSAEDAIRASAPFGAQIRRRFWLSYQWRHGPAKEKTRTLDMAAPAASE